MRVEQRFLLVVGAAFLIPACGGGGSSGAPPATETGTTEADPSPPQGAGLTSGQPPFVRIVSPASGCTCHAGATITLKAVAVDPDTEIARVEFFDGSKLIGGNPAPPFVLAWGGVKAGTHVITAVAYDVQGLSATSEPITIFVLARDSDDDDRRDRRR